MSDKVYVHNGVEVVLTGRKANRKIEARTARGRGYTEPRVDTLHEITPADKELGTWMKWIRLEELYEIEESTDEEK